MDLSDKINAFEYFLKVILDWYNEAHPNSISNDISKVKAFKIHFLTVAASCDQNEKGLLRIFDNFYALPYGPVESHIYESINDFKYFELSNNSLTSRKEYDERSINPEIKSEIDSAVHKLRQINPNIITYKAFELVELTHEWKSWSLIFDFAKEHGSLSEPIPPEFIQFDNRIYSIQ